MSASGSGSSTSPSPPRAISLESQRPPQAEHSAPTAHRVRCALVLFVEQAWWTALGFVLLLAFCATLELLSDVGTSNLHLRSATLRAAGGSARLGARGMCLVRALEVAVVGLVALSLRQQRPSSPRRPARVPVIQHEASSPALGVGGSACALHGVSGSHATPLPASSGGHGTSTNGCNLPMDRWPHPNYPADCSSPAELKEQFRRQTGSALLCTLSGWVWLLLGVSGLLGMICSLLVAMGGHAAPGVLGEMLSHHGLLGRRSVLRRSLPILTWPSFDLTLTLTLALTLPRVALFRLRPHAHAHAHAHAHPQVHPRPHAHPGPRPLAAHPRVALLRAGRRWCALPRRA